MLLRGSEECCYVGVRNFSTWERRMLGGREGCWGKVAARVESKVICIFFVSC